MRLLKDTVSGFLGLALLCGILFLGDPVPGNAQTSSPKLLLSWRANTYTPSDYEGKSLPISASTVLVSVDLVENNRIIDLSNEPIEWYVSDRPAGAGRGRTRTTISLPELLGRGRVAVRVLLPSYRSGTLIANTEIPIVLPIAEIAPAPSGGENGSLFLRAFPYFFNTTDAESLMYEWDINGASPQDQENPSSLRIHLEGSGERVTIPVSLRIKNSAKKFESGGRTRNFSVRL